MPADINKLALSKASNSDLKIKEAVEEVVQKNPAAVALGRLGGLKGGKARAAKLSAQERKEIAKKAAKARWERRSP